MALSCSYCIHILSSYILTVQEDTEEEDEEGGGKGGQREGQEKKSFLKH